MVQNEWFSDKGGTVEERDLSALRSLLIFHGVVPEVAAADRHMAAVVHRNESEAILFLVDTEHKPREVDLAFRDLKAGTLEEIFPGETVLRIRRGAITLAAQGEPVRVFRLLEEV